MIQKNKKNLLFELCLEQYYACKFIFENSESFLFNFLHGVNYTISNLKYSEIFKKSGVQIFMILKKEKIYCTRTFKKHLYSLQMMAYSAWLTWHPWKRRLLQKYGEYVQRPATAGLYDPWLKSVGLPFPPP